MKFPYLLPLALLLVVSEVIDHGSYAVRILHISTRPRHVARQRHEPFYGKV